eukprot:Trichotokara_eunicae@DN5694_c0_g2_i5.p1
MLEPGVDMTPLMTWGEIGTPYRIQEDGMSAYSFPALTKKDEARRKVQEVKKSAGIATPYTVTPASMADPFHRLRTPSRARMKGLVASSPLVRNLLGSRTPDVDRELRAAYSGKKRKAHGDWTNQSVSGWTTPGP